MERVKEITGGEGVDCVYDSVGKDTFPALARLPPADRDVGLLRPVVGPAAAVHAGDAPAEGLALRHPADGHRTYLAKRPDLEASAAELFEALKDGTVKIAINLELPLKDAAEAHRALEARETTGATVLVP